MVIGRGCGEKEMGSQCLMRRVSVLKDEKSSVNRQRWWLHNNVNVLNVTVYLKMVKMVIFMCIFITIKKKAYDTKPAYIFLWHIITNNNNHTWEAEMNTMTKQSQSHFLPMPPFLSSFPAASFRLKNTETNMSHRSDADLFLSLSPSSLVP